MLSPFLAALLTLLPTFLLAQGGSQLATSGTRFWTGFMQNGFAAQSLKVNIMGAVGTTGTVSIPLAGWISNYTIPANGVAVVTVPNSAENSGSEIALPKGVLIEAADPVNVFISSFQNFTLDNSQVLPEMSIGDRYRVDAYHGVPGFNNLHKSELLIVATQDATQILITPSVATLGGHPSNIPFQVDLQAGQTYQVQAAFDHLDLTGTLIEATSASGACRPFAVYGGSMCANIPNAGCSACDHIFEQLLPLSTWGTKFFTVPVNGVNSYSYRVLAHENNTVVTIGGSVVATLNPGQKYELNGTNSPVCIQTSKPTSVTQLLEGIACAGSGDPSMVILSPVERFSTQATFLTPTSPQLNQHSVSLVVPNASVGQVAIDGSAINPTLFQSYNGCNTHKHVKLSISAGVHSVEAANGFQLYMFGLGAGESYASSVHDIASQIVTQDSLICGAGTITLNCPGPWTNIEWVAGSNPTVVLATTPSFTITPSQTDTYTVTGTIGTNGCPQTFSYNVGVPLTIPTEATVNGAASASICQYEQVQLALDPPPDPAWFDISWSPAGTLDDATRFDPIASPMTSTWYTVQVTSPTGCGTTVDSVFVQVSQGNILELNVSTTNDTICLGDQVTLSSQAIRVIAQDQFNAAPSAIWNSIQGGSVSSVCGSISGNALYFNAAGQRYAQTVGLNATNGHQVRFQLKIANGTAPCDDADPGENVVLEYSTTNGFSWSLIGTYNENSFPDFAAVNAAIPSAAQTNNTMFRIRQSANSGLGHDNWSIDNFTISRYDNSWLGYQWEPSDAVANNTSFTSLATPEGSDWFILNGTDPIGGCVYQDSVYITVKPAFDLEITPDTVLCAAAGIQLHAAPINAVQATYIWTPNNNTLSDPNIADPIASPQSTTIYTVNAVSEDGCTASAQVEITVGQLLDLTVSAAEDTICQGQQVQLQAIAAGADPLTYSWTNANSLNNSSITAPIATPNNTTTYACTVTEPLSGCSLTESITIHVTTGYTANAGNDVSLCSTLGHQLYVQHNVPNPSYQWSPGSNLNASNIQSPTILYEGSAIYTVVITDQNGCSVSDQISITRYFEGVPSQVDVSECANTPPNLTAPQTAVNYLWSTGQVTASITATESGDHTVTMTNSAGCEVSTTFDVVLLDIPEVDLGPDLSLCGTTSIELDAGPDGSIYNWSNGSIGQTISVNTSGTYSVSVTNSDGCIDTDQIQVQFNALPLDLLQDVTICETTPPTLNAGNNGSTFLWSNGSTSASIVPAATGTYSVTITTPQNCSATYDAYVDLVPQLIVDLGNDTSICQGQQLILSAGNPGATYEWSNLSTAGSILVTTSGTYGVSVNNGYCAASDMIVVSVDPAPTDELMDITQCTGTSATLSAGNPGSAFSWNTGDASSSIEVSDAGIYSVTITDPSGCTATFDASVQFVPPPIVDLGADTVLCNGEILILDAGDPPATYSWNTGANTRTIAVANAGEYSVEVNNGYCSRSDQITVLFNPSPEPIQARQHQFCMDDDPHYVTLDAGNSGSQFNWSTGETTRRIEAADYGWFSVTITNEYGCSLIDSVQVIEFCPSTIFAPNTFTPNGDGMNDIFLPIGNNIASMKLMIFDRWGTMIFQSTDPEIGWDGTYRGEFVTDDIYVWRINYRFFEDRNGKLGMEQELDGHIQVLR